MDWIIRPFRSQDRYALMRAIDAVCGEGRWMQTARFEPTRAWRHALDQPGCGHHLLLVAEARGEVVGWCRLFPTDSQSQGTVGLEASRTYREGAELGIGLLPAFRGVGIGRELVERAVAWARDAGMPAVHLTTQRTNALALGLFSRCGFVPAGGEMADWVAMWYDLEQAHGLD